jgi:hypothetical protein
VFVPATWADPFKQPMRIAPAFAAAKALQGDNPLPARDTAALAALVARIAAPDYLMLLEPAGFQGDLPPGVAVLARDPRFLLLRLP